MNLKSTLICATALLLGSTTYAQDKIYKRNGAVIEGKVEEIGTRTISYKKADNLEGPNYVIDKGDVDQVVYENGQEEVFGDARGPRGPRRPGMHSDRERVNTSSKKYGNNIIAASPMQIMDKGIGFGLSYERVLDKKRNMLSFYMPVAVGFNPDNDNYYYGSGRTTSEAYYIMPGLKFYPTGGKGTVRYSVGPNLAFISSKEEFSNPLYDTWGNVVGTQRFVDDQFTFGLTITNSLNINPTPHLHMGLELGLGFAYYNSNYGWFGSMDPIGIAQFGFKIGYRF